MLGIQFLVILRATISLFGDFWVLGSPKIMKISQNLTEIQKRGIGVAVHFRSLHLQPFFKQHFNYKKGMFPQAEYLSDRVISLPLYPKMTDEDVSRVIETVLGVLHSFRQ